MRKHLLYTLAAMALLPLQAAAQHSKDIPTVFTPNGDGQNDMFCISAEKMTSLSLRIISNKGEVIFETSTIETDIDGSHRSRCWDGKKGGFDVEMGQYIYILNAVLTDGNKYEDRGSVTLIR